MTSCSAYCRPEEGVHVIVSRTSYPASEQQHHVGTIAGYTRAPGSLPTCLPSGVEARLLAIEDAMESNADKAGYPHLILITAQIVA